MAQKNMQSAWYAQLKKPSFAPPSWLFGVVWTVLYIIIAVTFGSVFYRYFLGILSGMVALPFLLNLVFNVIYSPIQFRLKNNYIALADVILVVGTLVWALLAIYPYSHAIAIANLPYLLWGSFATVLQASITWLNRKGAGNNSLV